MIAKRLKRFNIQVRVPERIRLFFVNSYRSEPAKKARNAFFEFYAYKLLKPYFQYHLGQRNSPLQYLFVMSPMRSGSSLLVHLLNSNPEIEGFGESHCPYSNDEDLKKLIYRTAVIQKSFDFENASYVMDKMVQNYYEISDTILRNQQVKFIFLLRDPLTSFKSAAKLGESCYGLRQYQQFGHWFQYYQERLDFLQNIAKSINDQERCLFVCYEDLLQKTQASLQTLQTFLKTDAVFSEEYTVSQNTGILRYGDPSKELKSGKILHQKNPIASQSTIFSEDERELAYHTHDSCVNTLTQFAQTIVSDS